MADIANPENNILFMKLLRVLNLLVTYLIFFIFSHFLIKNDNMLEYYQHLLDLGYEPKLNILIRICFYINSILFNFILYISLILTIFVILSLYIRAIFGGFSSTIILNLKIYSSFIISIVIFALLLVSAAGCALNITFFMTYTFNKEIIFENSLLASRFIICS